MVSVELEHKAFWTLKFLNFDPKISGEKRKLQLNEIDELRLQAYDSNNIYKQKVKKYNDKKFLNKNFKPKHMVLSFNLRLKLFSGKLKSKWLGPFQIKKVKDYISIVLEDPISKGSWTMNGQRLKLYLGGEIDRFTTIIPLGDP